MPDVFISYAREDHDRAVRLASELQSRGWSVWWDRKVVAGQSFDQTIERELSQAGSVVVLWSDVSVHKTWVRNEARRAAARGVLVPAMIDAVDLPLEFSDKQAADLIGWDGDTNHAGFRVLCEGIAAALGAPPMPPPPPKPGRRWLWATVITGAIALVAALGGYWALTTSPREVPEDKGINEAQKVPDMGTRPAVPPAGGELRAQVYRKLGAAQRQAVEKLIAGDAGALTDVEQNLEDIQRAADGFPEDAGFLTLLGYARKDVYQSTRRLLPEEKREEYLALARQAFEQALERDPSSAGARNGMGNVLTFECRFDEAIVWYDKALEVAPSSYRSTVEGDRRMAVSARQRKLTCPLP